MINAVVGAELSLTWLAVEGLMVTSSEKPG